MARSFFLFLAVLLFVTNPTPVFSEWSADFTYKENLLDRAAEKSLFDDRFWHLLLHYRPGLFGLPVSEEDSPAFFNSPSGKTDPPGELAATIEAFFTDPEGLKEGEEHPQCIFPARYKWLKSKLSFDPEKLPEAPCKRLEGWMKGLDPEKITLVFSSFYMNNPASMFGHTLLRIDKKRTGSDHKLLNYGVNYSALVDTPNTFLFIFKGLFGFFEGRFTVFPYYIKVQEYSNLESRDLWEYELNFSDDQIDYFLRHLWELGGNYFNYYYFQENCSYHILSLLEVANPELRLTDQFAFQVIPTETVKALDRNPGLIAKRVYRPSLLSQMNDTRIKMSSREKNAFNALSRNRSSLTESVYLDLSPAERALVLDAYLDLIQFRNMKKEKDELIIDKETREILLLRSRLGIRHEIHSPSFEFSTPPELGHGSARFGTGYGRLDGEPFQHFSLRPAYHDLLAKETGYGPGSQILFMEINGRYYRNLNKTKVESFKLLDIISLTPFEPVFRKNSWKLSAGVDSIKDFDCGLCNSFNTNYGFGYSVKPSLLSRFLFYSLLEGELELSDNLPKNYRLGGGGVAGGFMDITKNWKVELRAEYLDFPVGHDSDYYRLDLNQRYALSQNLEIRLELSNLKNRKGWLASFNYYF